MKQYQHLTELMAVMAVMIAGALNSLAAVPRPEHPRPDLQRENWITLNGQWQFEIDKAADGESRGLTYGKDLNARIIVPFCPESKLSGLGVPTTEHMKHVWYRRTFQVPTAMKGKRVRIHFGGVDYRSWVYINGQLAGMHIGENAAFNFEITRFLKDGQNEVVVKVLDDLWSGLQPGGKQSGNDQSAGCFYTRTTGIWQPVWLEAVGSSFVENISVVPDSDNSRVLIEAKINGAYKDLKLTAEAALPRGALAEIDLASDTAWTLSADGGPARPIKVPRGGWNSDWQEPRIDTKAGVKDYVVYERKILVPRIADGQVTKISFGAVNYGADVLVNDKLVGSHAGPLTPFEMEITGAVEPGKQCTLKVKAYHRGHYMEDYAGSMGLKGKICTVPVSIDNPLGADKEKWAGVWWGKTCLPMASPNM